MFQYVFVTDESKNYLFKRLFVSTSYLRLVYPIIFGLIFLGLGFSLGLTFIEGLSLIEHDASIFVKGPLYSIPFILLPLLYFFLIFIYFKNTPYKKSLKVYCGNKYIKRRLKEFLNKQRNEHIDEVQKVKHTNAYKVIIPRIILQIIPFILFVYVPLAFVGGRDVVAYVYQDALNHYLYNDNQISNAHYLFDRTEESVPDIESEYYLETFRENNVNYYYLMHNGEQLVKVIENTGWNPGMNEGVVYEFEEYVFIYKEAEFLVYSTTQETLETFLFDDPNLSDSSTVQGVVFTPSVFMNDGDKVYILGDYMYKGMIITFDQGSIQYKEMKLQSNLEEGFMVENGYYYSARITNVDNLYFKDTSSGMLHLIHEYIQFESFFKMNGELYYLCTSLDSSYVQEVYKLSGLTYEYIGEIEGQFVEDNDDSYIISGFTPDALRVYNQDLELVSETVVPSEFDPIIASDKYIENGELIIKFDGQNYIYKYIEDDYYRLYHHDINTGFIEYVGHDLLVYGVFFVFLYGYTFKLKKSIKREESI